MKIILLVIQRHKWTLYGMWISLTLGYDKLKDMFKKVITGQKVKEIKWDFIRKNYSNEEKKIQQRTGSVFGIWQREEGIYSQGTGLGWSENVKLLKGEIKGWGDSSRLTKQDSCWRQAREIKYHLDGHGGWEMWLD